VKSDHVQSGEDEKLKKRLLFVDHLEGANTFGSLMEFFSLYFLFLFLIITVQGTWFTLPPINVHLPLGLMSYFNL